MSPSVNDALLSALLSSWPSLLLDGLLLFLLLCAVLYAVRLSRAISAIHRGKAELAWLFARFAENIVRAEKLLQEMKRGALESQEAYMRRKEETERLTNDLGYLIEKGNGLADHMEETIGMAKETSSAALRRKPRYARGEKQAPKETNRERTTELAKEGTGRESISDDAGVPNLHNLR